jgi:hypothetical protein
MSGTELSNMDMVDVPGYSLTAEEYARKEKALVRRVRMRGYIYRRRNPTRWRFDLPVQALLYLLHYRIVLLVTESPKRCELQINLFGRWLDTG